MATKLKFADIDQNYLESIIIETCVNGYMKHVSRDVSLKRVAEKTNIPLEMIYKYYNTHPLGSKIKIKIEQEKSINNLSSELQKNNITFSSNDNNKKVVKSGKPPIDSDVVVNMLIDYEKGEMTNVEICNKYNVCEATLQKYRKLMDVKKGEDMRKKKRCSAKTTKRKSIEELRKEYVTPPVDKTVVNEQKENKDIIKSTNDNTKNENIEENIGITEKVLIDISFNDFTLKKKENKVDFAGLCADRHNMPVCNYIFETLKESEMFDFDAMYNHAYKWLQENVTTGNLCLYMTGMQSIFAATIKACHDQNINLTLLHKNNSTGKYEKQDIWKCDKLSEFDLACDSLRRKGAIYLTENIDNNKFYMITINKAIDDGEGFDETTYVCLSSMKQGFDTLQYFVEGINKYRGEYKLTLFLSECHIKNNKFIWDMTLTKSFNYK